MGGGVFVQKFGWSEGAALTLGGQRPRRQKTYDFDDL